MLNSIYQYLEKQHEEFIKQASDENMKEVLELIWMGFLGVGDAQGFVSIPNEYITYKDELKNLGFDVCSGGIDSKICFSVLLKPAWYTSKTSLITPITISNCFERDMMFSWDEHLAKSAKKFLLNKEV